MSTGKDQVWLLTFKGGYGVRKEQLGIGLADKDLSIEQQSLRKVAQRQNFDSSELGRRNWAHGAFVFVTVEHAAEIKDAIDETGIELKPHHVLVSGKYRTLVEGLLHTPVGNSDRDQYQSSRKGAIKAATKIPPKVFSHSESTSSIGPVPYHWAEVPVKMRNTFLECEVSSSDGSRQTRSTGDRPLKVQPSSKSTDAVAEHRLPPRDADYGSNRKRFHLRRTRKADEPSSGQHSQSSTDEWHKRGQDSQPSGQDSQPIGQNSQPSGRNSQPSGQDSQPSGQDSQPSGQDPRPSSHNSQLDVQDSLRHGSQPSGHDSQPISSESETEWTLSQSTSESAWSAASLIADTVDLEQISEMPSADATIILDLCDTDKYRKQLQDLDQELPYLQYMGDPRSEQLQEISTHFMARADICICIFADFMRSTTISPAYVSASSALEVPQERQNAIKALLRLIRDKALTFLTTIQPCLGIDEVFGNGLLGSDGSNGFATEMERHMQKKLKQLQDISGTSLLAEAASDPSRIELETLKARTENLVKKVLCNSLCEQNIKELLLTLRNKHVQMLQQVRKPMKEVPEDAELEALTPQERYELRKAKAKDRHIRKMIRQENRERNAPAKRGVPGATPKRGKRNA